MTNILFKKVEFFANLAIIVVAAVFVTILIKNHFIPSDKKGVPDLRVPIGSHVSLSGVDWSGNGRTLVLVLQKGCRYCTESAQFYQRLSRDCGTRAIQVIAVLPQQPEDSRKYLSDLGLSITDVRQSSLETLKIRATPTLILVDKDGTVTDSWVGRLSVDKESEVLARVTASGAVGVVENSH